MKTNSKLKTVRLLSIVSVSVIIAIFITRSTVTSVNAQTNDTNSTSSDPLTQACQGDKIIVENAKALQGSDAQSIVDQYNQQCGSITGPE